MKVGRFAAESAGSSVSGLSRVITSIDGWSAAGVDELLTGASAAVDVVVAAIAGGTTAAGGCVGSSRCWDLSGDVASVDDRTMNWLSEVSLVSVLIGCVIFGKWTCSSSSVGDDVSRMKAMVLFNVGRVAE